MDIQHIPTIDLALQFKSGIKKIHKVQLKKNVTVQEYK